MGAIGRLQVKLTRVTVPAHESVSRSGKIEHVDAYSYERRPPGIGPRSAAYKESTVFSYAENAYRHVNNQLRAAKGNDTVLTGVIPASFPDPLPTPTKQFVGNLDSSMSPTTSSGTVYRVMTPEALGMDDTTDLQDLVGKTITEHGYMSTSRKSFSEFSGSVLMELVVPKGTPAIDANASSNAFESEIILARNRAIKITGVRRDKRGFIVQAVVK